MALTNDGIFTHQPLPYVVHIRVRIDDDTAQRTERVPVVAYSLFEAMIQAVTVLTGQVSVDQSKYVVEQIEPDIGRYLTEFLPALIAAAAMAPKR